MTELHRTLARAAQEAPATKVVLALLVIAFLSFTTSTLVILINGPSTILLYMAAVSGTLFIFDISSYIALKFYASSKEADKLESLLEALPRKSAPSSRVDTLYQELKNSIERERVILLRTDARANKLFLLGTTFLVLSILGPILAGILYWQIEPLPSRTLEQFTELRKILGDNVNLDTPVQRDWRILVAGLSFGFLFLAAASGLLKQQARESRAYFRIGERINHYHRLASIVRVRLCPADADEPQNLEDVVKLVEGELLMRDDTSWQEDSAESDELKLSTSSVQALADQTRQVVKDALK